MEDHEIMIGDEDDEDCIIVHKNSPIASLTVIQLRMFIEQVVDEVVDEAVFGINPTQ